ncbi:MAG TPA: hypothetical protein VL309_01625 [Vicinamibacterales bacterium]|jgi:hypothetical protein|nr:hypothetical protein [Vicinamibacterales bacterium]
MFAIALTLALAAAPPPPAQTEAGRIAITTGAPLLTLDMEKLKGEPSRLAWSADAKELYLQTVEHDGHGAVKSTKHYVITLASKTVKSVDQEPAWASEYWAWKSAQTSPAAAGFRISVDQRTETKRATATPTGGDLAKGGNPDPTAGTSLSDVASAANQTQTLNIFALKIRSEVLGEWINEAVAPGLNFGWAPAPLHAIAFARRDGDRRETGSLVLLDESGRKEDVANAKAAWLPAFSDDGKALAWLGRKDKKHFELMVGSVGSR